MAPTPTPHAHAPAPTHALPSPAIRSDTTRRARKPIRLRTYSPQDLASVIELYRAGMLYYADKPNTSPQIRSIWLQYIEKSLEDDFARIHDVYFATGGHFWVATVQQDDGHELIVGTVGLEGKPNGEGELRRMSVRAEYRGDGVGRILVAQLENWAQAHGFAKVWLTTGRDMVEARKFYTSIQYTHTKSEPFARAPEFEAMFFEKRLIA